MKTGVKSPSSPRGTDSLSFTRSQRKRHPVVSFAECLGVDRIGSFLQGPSRSPAMLGRMPLHKRPSPQRLKSQASPANRGLSVWSKLLSTLNGIASPALGVDACILFGRGERTLIPGPPDRASKPRAVSFRCALGRRQFKVSSSPFGCWRPFIPDARTESYILVLSA